MRKKKRVVKKKKLITFFINLDVFDASIYFAFGTELEECVKFAKAQGHIVTKEDFDGNYGLYVHTPKQIPIIFCGVLPKTPHKFGVLVHEIYHAVDDLMRHYKIPFTKDTEEVRAMVMHTITEKAMEKIKGLK